MPEAIHKYIVVGVLTLLLGTTLFVYGIFLRPVNNIYTQDPFAFGSNFQPPNLELETAQKAKEPIFYAFVILGVVISISGLALINISKKNNFPIQILAILYLVAGIIAIFVAFFTRIKEWWATTFLLWGIFFLIVYCFIYIILFPPTPHKTRFGRNKKAVLINKIMGSPT
jgi:hypothetical protein